MNDIVVILLSVTSALMALLIGDIFSSPCRKTKSCVTKIIIEPRKLTKKELRAVQATAHRIKECARDENGRFAKAKP